MTPCISCGALVPRDEQYKHHAFHRRLEECTCITDPYTCPQGQALAQAIHDRKTAQGDG